MKNSNINHDGAGSPTKPCQQCHELIEVIPGSTESNWVVHCDPCQLSTSSKTAEIVRRIEMLNDYSGGFRSRLRNM